MPTYYSSQAFPRYSDFAGGSGFDNEGPMVVPGAETFSFAINAVRVPRIVRDASSAITVTASATANNIRATFSAAVQDNAALRNPANYSVSPGLEILAVTPEAVSNPTYVDLTVSEMKDGESYTLDVINTLEPA